MKKRSTTRSPFPAGLAQPALRALAGAGYDHLEQLASVPEEDVQRLHGIGRNALDQLRAALASIGLSFAEEKSAAGDITGYIAQFPADVQPVLEQVRAAIRRAAPEATETISYQMPAFKQHGIVVYFAAWKKHIGLYPPITGDKALERAVARYAGPKGNLQFPLDEPMPLKLIERIVILRVQQNLTKAANRKKKSQGSRKSAASAPRTFRSGSRRDKPGFR